MWQALNSTQYIIDGLDYCLANGYIPTLHATLDRIPVVFSGVYVLLSAACVLTSRSWSLDPTTHEHTVA
jgi:hypothetical protein